LLVRSLTILVAITGLCYATASVAAETQNQTGAPGIHQGLSATAQGQSGQALQPGQSELNLSNGCQIRFFDNPAQMGTSHSQVSTTNCK
jgi:hypothetical protein